MGVGTGKGPDKARMAAMAAISSPLLETSISGAQGVLLSITAAPDIGLEEVDVASTMIAEEAHPDANIIWGTAFDPSLEDEMRVTIIATGFDNSANRPAPAVTTAPATASAPADEKDDVAPAPKLSNEDFADIMSILNKSKR